MDQTFNSISIVILLTLLFTACKTDPIPIQNSFVNGKIYDYNFKPIPNVSIIKGEIVLARSKEDGTFNIDKRNLSDGEVISFKEEGFVTVTRVFKSNLLLNLFMKEREKPIVIDSREEQKLKYDSGIQLNIPKNAFLANKKEYEGIAQITATYLDVSNQKDLISSPGLFIAQDINNENLVPLMSFGIVEILAYSEENIPLQLKDNLGIEIFFPKRIEEDTSGVNFYSFNSESGYWNLESTLTYNNNQLQGVVTSVNSSWNADDPCSDQLVCVEVKVQYSNGNPGCGIGATGVSYQGFDGLYSPDQNGVVQLMVCPNSVFEIGACYVVCTSCPGPVYTKTIDLATIPLNPTGCTDIGTWVIQN